jgi:peptide methionine sulfoxide reductase MsrA
VVQITYGSAGLSLAGRLDVCFVLHDPTTLNRQRDDRARRTDP